MNRQAVVAGQFYPGRPAELQTVVGQLLAGAEPDPRPTILAMVPHAGYVYSGRVAGKTLGKAHLGSTILLLGPNHTGRGARLALWAKGQWELPGGSVAVDEDLAARLLEVEPRLEPDTQAHLAEHSLEVVLPFLRALNPEVRVVPVAVSESRLETLLAVGRAVGRLLREPGRSVSIVVSSDMSHYLSQERAQAQDVQALERVLTLDPAGLYTVVRSQGISMCGVLPMTLGLAAAAELGASHAELAAYDTSASASGDYAQVVGYAGVLVS